MVETIVTRGRADFSYQRVTSYKLLFSDNGANFSVYQETRGVDKVRDTKIFLCTLNHDTNVSIQGLFPLKPTIRSIYVKNWIFYKINDRNLAQIKTQT